MVSSAQVQNRNRKYEFATYAQSHTPSTTQSPLTTLRLPNGWSRMVVSNARRFQWRIQQRCRVDKAIAVVSQFCCGIVWPSQSTCSFLNHLETWNCEALPQNARRKQYWVLVQMDLSLFCPGFLCQVLNQTWDLLGFFMFTSKTSSKTTTTFQEWNKLDGHLSLGLGHYLYLKRKLNLLASSLGWSSKKSKLFSKAAL